MLALNNVKPIPTRDYLLEQMDDEFLLYHPTVKKVMYCNSTASLVWKLCNGERFADEIVTLIEGAYPVERDVLELEILQTLAAFEAHGAIMLVDERNTAVSLTNFNS